MPFTIPEEIIPSTLTVPDANNFFSIEDGGLPNGDDCLVVHGDVNRNYKAYQSALTLSPNVFLSRSSGPWSLSFWFKCASATDPAPFFGGIDQTLMGVQSAAGPASYSDTINHVWNMGAINIGATARIAMSMGDGGTIHYTPSVVRDGEWHLIVYTFAAGGTGAINSYVDDLAPTGSGSPKAATAAWTGMFFSIGSYGVHANSKSYNKEWRIAKLAFHDHALTLAERTSLYQGMVGTPPAVLTSALGWWEARNYIGSGNVLNKGTSGSALDLLLGSSTNAPVYTGFFTFDRTAVLYNLSSPTLPNIAANESFSVGIVCAPVNPIAVAGAGTPNQIIGKPRASGPADPEYLLQASPGDVLQWIVYDGTQRATVTGPVLDTTKQLLTGVRDVPALRATVYRNGAASTPVVLTSTNAIGNGNVFGIGVVNAGTNVEMKFYAAFLTKTALTPTQIAAISTYYGITP